MMKFFTRFVLPSFLLLGASSTQAHSTNPQGFPEFYDANQDTSKGGTQLQKISKHATSIGAAVQDLSGLPEDKSAFHATSKGESHPVANHNRQLNPTFLDDFWCAIGHKSLKCAPTQAPSQAPSPAPAPVREILYFIQDDNSDGLYSINTTTGNATNLGVSGVFSSTVGLAPGRTPGKLFGSRWDRINEINVDGSGFTMLGDADAEGLAYDPNNDTLWGTFNEEFFEIDTVNFTMTTSLAAAPEDTEGIAFGRGGVFGIGRFSANLTFYDIGLNTWSVVGNTGLTTGIGVGLAYSFTEDLLYGSDGSTNNLYSINPDTAVATLIGDTGITLDGGLAFQYE